MAAGLQPAHLVLTHTGLGGWDTVNTDNEQASDDDKVAAGPIQD